MYIVEKDGVKQKLKEYVQYKAYTKNGWRKIETPEPHEQSKLPKNKQLNAGVE